jgi:VanZ family protein
MSADSSTRISPVTSHHPHRSANAGLRRGWLACGCVLVIVTIVLSVWPRLEVPSFPSVSDKIQHVVAYASLMFWFAQLALSTRWRAATAGALIVLGIVIEFVQIGVPGRTFEIADMVANTVGVLAGWLAAPPRTPNLLAALRTKVSAVPNRS